LRLIPNQTYLPMKNIKRYAWLVLAFIAVTFSACDNEALEGEFQQEENNTAEPGEFVATIEGNAYEADAATAILYSMDNSMVISGLNSATGENITLSINNAGADSFNLNTGGATYFTVTNVTNPYVSNQSIGGSGQLVITDFDTVLQTVTGVFTFTGARPQLDSDGNPILDGNGDPVIQTIQVNEGAFDTIPYTVNDTDPDPDPDPQNINNFFANVDGLGFMPDMLSVTRVMVGGLPVINIIAEKSNGELIRIDIPESFGQGTFDMQALSDGTELIGLHNNGLGGENLTSSPGTITISEFGTLSGRLIGTFAFTGTDPLGVDPTVVEVTEGMFELTYMPEDTNNLFMADVDGVAFEPTSIVAEEVAFATTTQIKIEAVVGTTELNLFFPTDIVLGTYVMSQSLTTGEEVLGIYFPDNTNGVAFTSNPGTLTITSYDTVNGVIEGNFSFTATDPLLGDPAIYEVTSGLFKVTIVP